MTVWTFSISEKPLSFPCVPILTALLICSGGSLHFGYHLTMLNPPESMFAQFLNRSHHSHYGSYLTNDSYRWLWSMVISAMALGGVCGTFPLVKISERFGRRKALYISSVLNLAGILVESLSKWADSYELFAVGRFLVGFGSGLGIPVETMYLNEISPVRFRGFITSFTGIFVQLGFLLGGVFSLSSVFGTESLWPWMFLIEIPSILVLMVNLPFLHESPKYLYSKNLLVECERALAFFNCPTCTQELESEAKSTLEKAGNLKMLRELGRKPYLRKAIGLCICVVFTAAFSGITYLEYFSTNILRNVGLPESTAEYSMILMFAPSLVAAIFGSCIVEQCGRRPLLLWTTSILILMNIALMTLSLIYESYPTSSQWTGFASLAVSIVFCLAFGLGPALLQWSVASEMFPQNVRATAQFVVQLCQRVGSLVAVAAFYPLQGLVGSYVFLFYIIPLIVCLSIFVPLFPETRKKTVVEIMRDLGHDEGEEMSLLGD